MEISSALGSRELHVWQRQRYCTQSQDAWTDKYCAGNSTLMRSQHDELITRSSWTLGVIRETQASFLSLVEQYNDYIHTSELVLSYFLAKKSFHLHYSALDCLHVKTNYRRLRYDRWNFEGKSLQALILLKQKKSGQESRCERCSEKIFSSF